MPQIPVYNWCVILALLQEIPFTFVQNLQPQEVILERFLKTMRHMKWIWDKPDLVRRMAERLVREVDGRRASSLYIIYTLAKPKHLSGSWIMVVQG